MTESDQLNKYYTVMHWTLICIFNVVCGTIPANIVTEVATFLSWYTYSSDTDRSKYQLLILAFNQSVCVNSFVVVYNE